MYTDPHLCPKALAEGQYRWRSYKVVTEIVRWVEQQRVKSNNKQARPSEIINFMRARDKAPKNHTLAKNPRVYFFIADENKNYAEEEERREKGMSHNYSLYCILHSRKTRIYWDKLALLDLE